jgi:formate/nitrite transporter FocA (FNT family)
MEEKQRSNGPPLNGGDSAVPETEHVEHHEQEEVEERSAVRTAVVHAAIVRQGEEELERNSGALFWSAVAAGLSMTLSLVAEGVLRRYLPDSEWRPLISKLGYTVGFLIVILGRQQLFTENTLTALLPFFEDSTSSKFWNVMRLWAIVFLGNMIGVHAASWAIGNTPALPIEVQTAMADTAREAIRIDFGAAFVRGIFGGWLIALVVWLRTASDRSEALSIVVPTYLIGIAHFTHVVAGAAETFFLVWIGQLAWTSAWTIYIIPVLLGNIVGGSLLVTALHHGQIAADEPKH